jgi:hypothetical protein
MNSPRIRRALSATTAGRAPKIVPRHNAASRRINDIRIARRMTTRRGVADPALVAVVWDVLSRAGSSGGRVLEPGCGSGTFIGHAAPHAVTVPRENDASTAASPRPLPVGPNQK